MIHSGLVSVTFRQLKPQEIVQLVRQGGLEMIEWGGDVHVPPGDQTVARQVAQITQDAGLGVASYGSYYHVAETHPYTFEDVVETAQLLGAPTIRVWAGARGSAVADEAYRAQVVADTRRIAGLAEAAGMTISFEFHSSSLTDTNASALWLLREVNHPAVRCYWQPNVGATQAYCLEGLHGVLPWLTNVHVFRWYPAQERWPLAAGAADWQEYLKPITAAKGEHTAMIEFVKDDAPEQFLRDAATLKAWLAAQ
jgi:sugar phosphate isomerase/epimerase